MADDDDGALMEPQELRKEIANQRYQTYVLRSVAGYT
jgi:hypothetical protein